MKKILGISIQSLTVLFATFSIQAQQNERIKDSVAAIEMPQVLIISKKNTLLNQLPGSVGMVDQATIRQTAPISGNEVFRRISGIHVVEEEGAGLRMNLGIRGLDPDRSRSVLVLEDGVPVALNPYGEPELYYTPIIDRMQGVEVLKGSGQILFGPQTIGGVVNFITKDPPSHAQGRLRVSAGDFGYLSALASYGSTYGNTGFHVSYFHKQASKLGYTNFNTDDLCAKLKFKISDKSSLGVKLGYYNEQSNATYIGLTQNMYEAHTDDFVLMAPDDHLSIKRISFSATHQFQISERLRLVSTAYAYTTSRDWQRQDFATANTISNGTGVIWGDTNVSGGAVYMRDQNAHRNRSFEVMGLEPRLYYNYQIHNMTSELQAGIRLNFENANEQRLNGKKADSKSGELVEDELRHGKAISAFAHNSVSITEKINLTAGVRVEHYDYEREILRNSFMIGNALLVRDTNLNAGNQVTSILPGIGLNINVSKQNTLFAGLHRGFAPPRVKDAISNQGQIYALDAEKSWNVEVGTRGKVSKYFEYEATLFSMNFSNQIIPESESSGGTGSGLVNGGRTLHRGVELAFMVDFGNLLKSRSKINWKTNATYNKATFNKDRFLKEGSELVNISGNITPYAPEYYASTSFYYLHKLGLGAQLSLNAVGAQYTDALNSELPASNGRTGKLKAYTIADVNILYNIPKTKVSLNVAVKNISNERYIVSRRPQGIRVGNPRFISAGVDVSF